MVVVPLKQNEEVSMAHTRVSVYKEYNRPFLPHSTYPMRK